MDDWIWIKRASQQIERLPLDFGLIPWYFWTPKWGRDIISHWRVPQVYVYIYTRCLTGVRGSQVSVSGVPWRSRHTINLYIWFEMTPPSWPSLVAENSARLVDEMWLLWWYVVCSGGVRMAIGNVGVRNQNTVFLNSQLYLQYLKVLWKSSWYHPLVCLVDRVLSKVMSRIYCKSITGKSHTSI